MVGPSTRTPVVVVVTPNLDVVTATPTPATVCPGESVSIAATSANGSTVFNWYDAATGGTLLFTGNPYVTTVSATTTFYVESETGSGCVSARTPVIVTVVPSTDVPTAIVTPATPCAGETVTMTGTSIDGSTIFHWYDAATAGNLLFTGNPYVTTVNSTTTYYLETENASGCRSVRTPVLVTVTPSTDVPTTVATPANVCPGESVSMTATSVTGATIFNWYDAVTGGTLLFTGNPYVTTVSETTTFYVESETAGGCLSLRTPVIVTVLPNPDVPVGTPTPATVCPGESVSIAAASINGSSIFHWYDDATAGTLLFTGQPFVTSVNATTTFYLESENGSGCVSPRTPVVVTVLPNLDVPVATPLLLQRFVQVNP